MNAIRIVLIEDNPGDVYLVELALKETGLPCELTRFASGVEALSVLCPAEDAPPPFVPDAILLDLNTPKSDGFQVLNRLKLGSVPAAKTKAQPCHSVIRHISSKPELQPAFHPPHH